MNEFDLDRVIYRFNDQYPFTIRDACEGVQIMGGIGSGKTSGSGAALAKAYLRSGMGGLILTAKKEELSTWERYAEQTGRKDSLLVIDASGKYRFPVMQYEIEREGDGAGNTENLVRMLTTVHEAISRDSGRGGDPFWTSAMQELMRNAIDLCIIARGTVSIPLMAEVVRTAPQSLEQIHAKDEQGRYIWRESSLCWKLIEEAGAKELDYWTEADLHTTFAYWLENFPQINPKTRSGIIAMFSATMDSLLRRPFRMLFSEPPEDPAQIAYPELSHHGAVIVVHLPVKEFGNAGRAAQVIYKYAWQQAAERRNIKENPRPVFLWVDEAQNFATEYDQEFQATARSSRACTVYLTQNLPNYFAAIGNRDRVHSLVGNFATKIFHANGDPETNNYAAEVIGKSFQTREGSSYGFSEMNFNMGGSRSESFDYDVPPQVFTMLPKGGPGYGNQVGAVVFQNGRIWEREMVNDQVKNYTYLAAMFKQS